MSLFKSLFKRKDTTLTRYISVPTLYPMGAMTFAIACSHCKNMGSDKCPDCKCEKKSGFEPKFPSHSSPNLCVCCGEEIPEGYHVCLKCMEGK